MRVTPKQAADITLLAKAAEALHAENVALREDRDLLDKLDRYWRSSSEDMGTDEMGVVWFRRAAVLVAIRKADDGYPDIRSVIRETGAPEASELVQ